MIRANMSFLPTKARERSREEPCPRWRSKKAPALLGPDPSHREKLAVRPPCCAPLGKSQLLFGPQCPYLRNRRGWPYACSPLQIPPLSRRPTLMLGLALPPYPCQKEEKKLALVVRGGHAARGCQAAQVVAG